MIVFIKCRKPSLEIISSHSFSALPPQFPSANPVVCVLSLGSREAPASYHPHPRPPAGAFVSRASTVRLLFLCLRNQGVLLRCPPAGISDAVRLNSKKTRGVCFMGCPFPHRGHTSFPSFPHTFSNFLFDAKHWDAKLCRAFAVLLKVCFVGLFMWQAVESLLEAFEAQESLLSMQLGSLPCRPVCSAWGFVLSWALGPLALVVPQLLAASSPGTPGGLLEPLPCLACSSPEIAAATACGLHAAPHLRGAPTLPVIQNVLRRGPGWVPVRHLDRAVPPAPVLAPRLHGGSSARGVLVAFHHVLWKLEERGAGLSEPQQKGRGVRLTDSLDRAGADTVTGAPTRRSSVPSPCRRSEK